MSIFRSMPFTPMKVGLTRFNVQTIPNAALTAIVWDTELYQTGAMHSVTVNPSRITVSVPGIYLFTTGMTWPPAGGVRRFMVIQTSNGTVLAQNELTPNAGTFTSHSVAVQWQMTAGDYVVISVFQDSGAPLNTFTGGVNPLFGYLHAEASLISI